MSIRIIWIPIIMREDPSYEEQATGCGCLLAIVVALMFFSGYFSPKEPGPANQEKKSVPAEVKPKKLAEIKPEKLVPPFSIVAIHDGERPIAVIRAIDGKEKTVQPGNIVDGWEIREITSIAVRIIAPDKSEHVLAVNRTK